MKCDKGIDEIFVCEDDPRVPIGFASSSYSSDTLIISNLIFKISFKSSQNKLTQVSSLIFEDKSQMKSIDNNLFFSSLPELTLVSQYPPIRQICDRAFINSPKLRTFTASTFPDIIGMVVISYHTQHIGEYSFHNTSIEKIVLTFGITVIGDGAFSGCKNLTSLVGYPLRIVPPYLFANSSKLETFIYNDKPYNLGCYLGRINYVKSRAFPDSGFFFCIYEDSFKNLLMDDGNIRLENTINSKLWCREEYYDLDSTNLKHNSILSIIIIIIFVLMLTIWISFLKKKKTITAEKLNIPDNFELFCIKNE
jgi:hypothetical protein